MSAGTLSLTNKSDAVLGTGTAFTTDLKAGDFIVFVVGGTGYTLPVKSIASNTQLTLSGNYTGPTQSNISWFAVPREAQSLITAGLASQITEALRGLNADKYNWQQVFSEDANITVRLPDGSEFTGPSWLKVVELLKDIDLEVLQVIAGEIDADAQQVAADKVTASNAAQTATDAAAIATQKAQEADTSAANAESSETSAADSAASAGASATTATEQADRAQTEADRAEQAANQAGGVKTVNGVSPDASGGITITTDDIKDPSGVPLMEAVRAYVDAVCPIGTRMDWPLATLPDNPALGIKFLRLTGASFDKALYPKLAERYPSGILPDMRGDTVRGYDDGRGIDQGRELLSEQLDAMQAMTGTFRAGRSGNASGVFTQTGTTPGTAQSGSLHEVDFLFNNANVVRTANETRMRNMAWNMIVRAS
ncbi:hypothetical protein ACT48S_003190 [Cronobacter sakazakii]